MTNEKIESFVNDLIQVDIDATFAYDEAINAIKEDDIKNALLKFKEDHVRHIENLSNLLKEIGGKPVQYGPDLKGQVIRGMTWLRGMTGTKGALKAMVSNEKITNEKYQEAIENKDLPMKMLKQISDNFEDEKAHLKYVKNKLAELEMGD